MNNFKEKIKKLLEEDDFDENLQDIHKYPPLKVVNALLSLLVTTNEELKNRVVKSFGEVVAKLAENDIIVCHGNVIRYFVTKVLNVDTMSWLQMSIGNCSLTIIRMKPDGSMKLVSFNDVGHIPPNMQTETGGNNDLKELLIH